MATTAPATAGAKDDHFKKVNGVVPTDGLTTTPVKPEDYDNMLKMLKKIKDPAKLTREEKGALLAVSQYQADVSGMPRNYIGMTLRFKSFWLWFNLIAMIVSAALGAGTVLILEKHPEDCMGIKIVSWFLFGLHVMTFLAGGINMCGLEKKICNTPVFVFFLVFNGVILTWSQMTYFNSQEKDCNVVNPPLYFWLMFEIMVFYVLTAFIVCYFFRRFCQDPKLKQEEDEGMKEEMLELGHCNADIEDALQLNDEKLDADEDATEGTPVTDVGPVPTPDKLV